MATIERALEIALEAHRDQTDRADEPYILHPLRIMLNMKSTEKMLIATLHDVVEDSDWTLEDLRNEGFSDKVVNGVDSLSKRPDEDYKSYIERVKKNPDAIPIKLGDLGDNMNFKRLAKVSEKDCQRLQRYHWAYKFLKSGE